MSLFRDLNEEEQKALGLANLDVLLSTRASEVTLLSVLNQVAKDNTLDEIVEVLNTINSSVDTASTTISSEINEANSINSNRNTTYLSNILEELKLTNKLLGKIYDHE